MGVGAMPVISSRLISTNIIIWIAASGFFSAAIGVLFGLPSLRIRDSIWRWRRWRRSSSCPGFHQAALV
jgi:ABC-type branched-subunit amino acid transport system permease subunit